MRATYFFSKKHLESHLLEIRTPGFPRAQHILETKVLRLIPAFPPPCLANPVCSCLFIRLLSTSILFPIECCRSTVVSRGRRTTHPVPAHLLVYPTLCSRAVTSWSLLCYREWGTQADVQEQGEWSFCPCSPQCSCSTQWGRGCWWTGDV